MELNFNKEQFAKILKNINETYNSQRDFAKESGINRTYISQYMNLKLDEPPKPKILKRLAYFSNDIVSYEELMEVCGYINNPTIEFSEKERTKIKVLTALKNLEIMGDCFAKRDTQIVRDYITDIEAENQKLKEELLQQLRIAKEKETHRYNKICISCNKEFIAKRSDTKCCPSCSHKFAAKKYRETHRTILAEKSKIYMRKYRKYRKD